MLHVLRSSMLMLNMIHSTVSEWTKNSFRSSCCYARQKGEKLAQLITDASKRARKHDVLLKHQVPFWVKWNRIEWRRNLHLNNTEAVVLNTISDLQCEIASLATTRDDVERSLPLSAFYCRTCLIALRSVWNIFMFHALLRRMLVLNWINNTFPTDRPTTYSGQRVQSDVLFMYLLEIPTTRAIKRVLL